MKQMTCEMCGSTELVKQDGFFVCQTCGTKYSVEEAKKMMVEGTVNLQISRDNEVPNLLRLAKTANAGENYYDAVNYAEEILTIDASNADAWAIKALNLHRTLPVNSISFETIKATTKQALSLCDENTKTKLADDIVERVLNHSLFAAGMTKIPLEIISCYNSCCDLIEEIPEVSGTLVAKWYDYFCAMRTHQDYKNIIENRWGDPIFADTRPDNRLKKLLDDRYPSAYKIHLDAKHEEAYKKGQEWLAKAQYAGDFRVAAMYFKNAEDFKDAKELLSKCEAEEKTHPEDPSRKTAGKSSGGCYVATCVYGSYDCPQVWTLRRYRDDTLGSTWYGRMFIRTYYAISPTLVKWFGKTNWFKKLWKGKLDRMVAKLQNNGVEDTPYEDKEW